MNLLALMKGVYVQLSTDEKLLRLLHYIPVNQDDNPLSEDKPNITTMDIESKSEIIDNVLYHTDKKFKLDLKSKFSRINFYLDERKPERVYSAGARKLVNNPLVSRQELVVDIHTNIEIDRIDMRQYQIVEQVEQLLNNRNYKQLVGLKFSYGYTIKNTPDGFIGYRLIYYVMSPQQVGC